MTEPNWTGWRPAADKVGFADLEPCAPELSAPQPIARELVEFHQNRYAAALDALVTPRTRWLDLGCGAQIHGGWLGIPQAMLAARARSLTGVDTPEQLARNLFVGVQVMLHHWGNGFARFHSECYDLITLNMVVEHITDPEGFFLRATHFLAPGGRVLILTPQATHPVVAIARLVPRWLRSWFARLWEGRDAVDVFPTYYRANTPRTIRWLAALEGLEVVRIEAFASLPFVRSGPFAWIERGLIRLGQRWPWLWSNLLVELRKP